ISSQPRASRIGSPNAQFHSANDAKVILFASHRVRNSGTMERNPCWTKCWTLCWTSCPQRSSKPLRIQEATVILRNFWEVIGAGEGNRTLDTQLGKLMFYH